MASALAVGALVAAASTPQPLALEAGAHHPVLSPDGTTLLYSSVDHNGLKALNLTSGDVTVIDEGASAGFNPVFSCDGSKVFYRTASVVDGLMYRDIRSFDFNNGAGRQLAAPSRDRANLASLGGASTYAFADYRTIDVTVNGKSASLSPLPDAHSYLWASLSPDASRLAFTEPFSGVYVSNVDGTEARRVLDKGDFASWAGESTLIAVVSHDDGYVILDSHLVAVDVNTGAVTTLTDDNMLVGEATASASGLVVFSDLNGNMYMLNLNK